MTTAGQPLCRQNAPKSFRFTWQLSNKAHKHHAGHLAGPDPSSSPTGQVQPLTGAGGAVFLCLWSFTSDRPSFPPCKPPADVSWRSIRFKQCVHVDLPGIAERACGLVVHVQQPLRTWGLMKPGKPSPPPRREREQHLQLST